MKPAKLLSIGLLVAVPVAAASAGYLYFTKQNVQRVITPVDLHAPDLYPSSTLLYAEVHGLEASYDAVDAWWKKLDATSVSLFLHRMWDKNRGEFPPPMVESLKQLETQLAKCEAKFGYRPTARDFFTTYGRHLAVGLLPADAAGKPPVVLLTFRLPEGAAASALQERLGKAEGLKPATPPLHHNFPMFQEEGLPPMGTITYGVGRGYLLVSDSQAQVQAALDRLATATDGPEPKRPTGVLSDDPILRRVCAAPGQGSGMVLYARKDQKFGQWQPDFAIVDEYFRNAFVLAPKDDAVAFAFGEKPGERVKCSFHDGTEKPWTQVLPSGLYQLETTLPADGVGAWQQAQLAALLDKPIWKETGALLRDPARLRKVLEETMPKEQIPDDELLGRIPNDAKLLGDIAQAMAGSLAGAKLPSFAFASKNYTGEDGRILTQNAFGFDVDPFATFMIAGGLDLAKSKLPEWIVREEKPGVLIWKPVMERILHEMESEVPPEGRMVMDQLFKTLNPAIVITGNRMMIVNGQGLLNEIVDLATAGKTTPFDKDPLFVEARGQLKPGYMLISWSRPAEWLKAMWGGNRVLVDTILKEPKVAEDPKATDAINSGVKTVDDTLGWFSRIRAELSVTYPDLNRPSESVVLVDDKIEAKGPSFGDADAPLGAAKYLPAGTWGLFMQRLSIKEAAEALKKSFVSGLPGGEKEFSELMNLAPPEAREFLGDFNRVFVSNLRGEVGLAVSLPLIDQNAAALRGPDAFIARAPAFFVFAQFERGGDALKALKACIDKIHAEMNPEPFEQRLAEAQEQGYPWPAGSRVVSTKMGEGEIAAIDFLIPMEAQRRYQVVSVCAIQRGEFIFITNSVPAMTHLASTPEGGPATLTAALATKLPAGTLPAKMSGAILFRPDAIAENVRMLIDMVLPEVVPATLQGLRQRPTPERMQAREKELAHVVDLVQDLFSTGRWKIDCTTREGNVIRRVDRRVAEQKH